MKKIISIVVSVLFGGHPALAQSNVTASHANRLVEHYRAYIGEADLFNSSGTRLTQPWQIIRQDRANFHRYGIRDSGDQSDSFFADPANRQSLEAMLRSGSMTREAAAMIVHGNVWVDVDIYSNQGTGRWIDVTVSD